MVLLRLRTGLVVAGRLLRGRWFNGPVGTAAIAATGGTSAGAITAFNNAGAGLLAAGATTTKLAVWNRPTNVVGTSAEVTSVSTWEKLAVMRSRRDG